MCPEAFLHIWVPGLTSRDGCCTLFATGLISHFSSNFSSWEHLNVSAGPFYTTWKTLKLSGCHKHIFLFCSSNKQLCPTVIDFSNKNTWSSSLAKICPHWHSTNGFHKHDSGSVWKCGQWHSTPVLLPGKSHGRGSLVGFSPWGHEQSDMTEWLHFHFSLSCIGEGNGNPLQCSCLENPRDGGAWWAAVYGVAQS